MNQSNLSHNKHIYIFKKKIKCQQYLRITLNYLRITWGTIRIIICTKQTTQMEINTKTTKFFFNRVIGDINAKTCVKFVSWCILNEIMQHFDVCIQFRIQPIKCRRCSDVIVADDWQQKQRIKCRIKCPSHFSEANQPFVFICLRK